MSLAILLFGRVLGQVVDTLSVRLEASRFWELQRSLIHPEPTEQASFVISLLGPAAIVVALMLLTRRRAARSVQVVWIGSRVAQLATAAALAACMVAQYGVVYGAPEQTPARARFFTPATLVAASLIAASAALLLHRRTARASIGGLLRESRASRVVTLVVAVTMTALWMLHAVNSDASLGWSPDYVWSNLAFTFDETFAVVNGRTPLVDFTGLYGALWPFVAAVPLVIVGKTTLVFTVTMCVITGVAMLAVFDLFRRVTRSSVGALALFLPVLATSLYMIEGTHANRSSVGTYFGAFPLRYAGPLLLAWLTARYLDRARRRAAWPLFAVGGLVLLNNLDFGVGALAATVAALLWTSDERGRRSLLRLGRDLLIGLTLAFALVSVITLARTGSLPHPERALDYTRLYASGFAMAPLRGVLGLHLIVYATFAAAIVTATVRAIDGAENRVLTGTLVWSGIFGFGMAGYFVGQTWPVTLVVTFAPWMLSLALLTVVVLQSAARGRSSWVNAPQLMVLIGFGIAVCSLAQTPTPWSQIDRLTGTHAPSVTLESDPRPLVPDPALRNLYASAAYGPSQYFIKRGAPAALLVRMGHRAADAFGIVNVSPAAHPLAVPTREVLRDVVNELRRAGGNTLIAANSAPDMGPVLVSWGFRRVVDAGTATKWVDTRNLYPRFLEHGRGTPVPPA